MYLQREQALGREIQTPHGPVVIGFDKLLLRKRSLIETINDQLKNICQIEHTRHRSPTHFLVHLLAGLIAYARQPKKPSLNLGPDQPPPANTLLA